MLIPPNWTVSRQRTTRRNAFAAVAALIVLSACSGESTDTTSPPSHAQTTAPATEGRILVASFSDADKVRLSAVSESGDGAEPFFPGEEFETRNLSPDGSRLAIVTATEDGVLVSGYVTTDGTSIEVFDPADQTLNLACGVWGPGKQLTCEGWDDTDPSRSGLYSVRSSDGGAPRQLTSQRDIPCDYSPDGSQLAFIRAEGDGSTGTLMTMPAAGGDPRPLLPDVAVSGISCDWSPDGTEIVAAVDGSLMLVTPDGETSPLTGSGIYGYASGGTWSPSGTRILFTMSLEGEQFDVYTAASDGTDLRQVTHSPQLEEGWSWLS